MWTTLTFTEGVFVLGFATTSPTVMGWDWIVPALPLACGRHSSHNLVFTTSCQHKNVRMKCKVNVNAG